VECSLDDDQLAIADTTDDGVVSYEACGSITFGPGYQVGASGDVTARAPTVALGEVAIAGRFRVVTTVP
jgi:hypothetical protein